MFKGKNKNFEAFVTVSEAFFFLEPFHLPGEFRNEGFGTFGPGGIPVHRPPPFGQTPPPPLGIVPRNGPSKLVAAPRAPLVRPRREFVFETRIASFVVSGFGARGIPPFSAPRGILPPPPMLAGRPGILSDMGGPRGMGAPPRGLGLRPAGMLSAPPGGPMQGPRGLPGPPPPGIVGRFPAPPAGFPRFGVIGGPRGLPPPSFGPMEEAPSGPPPAPGTGPTPVPRSVPAPGPPPVPSPAPGE